MRITALTERGDDMPNLVLAPFYAIADLTVASHQHKMPPEDSWKRPQDGGQEEEDNYKRGVTDRMWGPSVVADGFVSYFTTQDPHMYHVTSAMTNTAFYKSFIYTMIQACESAFNQWRPTLHFEPSKVKIMGPSIIGQTKCLAATAKFKQLFDAFPAHASNASFKHYNKWKDAVGKGIEKCLNDYVDKVTLPGLPWYPAFAAFPAPVAPPMPNTPWPLIACPSLGVSSILVPKKLQDAMIENLDGECKQNSNDEFYKTVFEAIANAAALGFSVWLASQMVTNVLGQGNIPTFVPPPTGPIPGPVVNGTILPAPGGQIV